ncbi:MAG: hypothetical protein PUP92_01645 [Rhizonema sp. PD38]|nr:hypothetical protein [Rhizonema sp. PD38]
MEFCCNFVKLLDQANVEDINFSRSDRICGININAVVTIQDASNACIPNLHCIMKDINAPANLSLIRALGTI